MGGDRSCSIAGSRWRQPGSSWGSRYLYLRPHDQRCTFFIHHYFPDYSIPGFTPHEIICILSIISVKQGTPYQGPHQLTMAVPPCPWTNHSFDISSRTPIAGMIHDAETNPPTTRDDAGSRMVRILGPFGILQRSVEIGRGHPRRGGGAHSQRYAQ
ncbi:hypothetical protein ASPBRDRAFT_330878 [Aspergillus brasiliensis CBS 101740]|uniref:Uncharacterized protein n=1 Tax=Aspergillus brasiliensis (strain CBS 101740 / IMI 381727 / IBT 21946) TaxID=767769 RepID=A0A1L9U8R3_ASPBC|nr:hypothetical protein ASPBRDRAFT_330878 [Aspergillus brasiliensis CBS 101740]